MTIYFIQKSDDKAIKIGYTAGDPKLRMKQLQTGQPSRLSLLGSIPGEKDAEKGLHDEFVQYRLHGEWFEPHSFLISTVEMLMRDQCPWYFCRSPQILYAKMASEWRELFGASDFSCIDCQVGDIDNSIRCIRKFEAERKRLEEWKRRRGFSPPWRGEVYKWFHSWKDAPSVKAAQYVLAWQGSLHA